MNIVEIFEQELRNGDKVVGKVAILRGGLNTDNPTAIMNEAVSSYVEHQSYNEFVEVFLDNPWVRVIVSGINELDYKEFNSQRL
jgi:hypothetical protein